MIMRVLFVVIFAALCIFGQAQISPLKLSSELQATGSNVTIYVNASSTNNVWQISWKINEVRVGRAKSRTSSVEVTTVASSPYQNRINISAGFAENNHTIKSEMVIMNLTKMDNLTIQVVGFGMVQKIQLNVKDCFVVLNGGNTTCGFGCITQFPCQQVPGTYPAVCQADAQWNTLANSSCPSATTTLSSASTELSITTGPKSNNNNHGAIIGIVVVLCIIVLVLFAFLVYRWKCKDNGFIRGKSSS